MMNNSTSTSCEPVSRTAQIGFMSVYSVIFLVGLFLNGFTLKVYFCTAQRQTSSSVTIYMKNLAAADFLISLCLPLRIMNYASSSIVIRQVYCNFGASAFYLNMYASILFMGYIAASRYLKIVHPIDKHSLQKPRHANIISMVTWGFLLVMTSTYVIVSLFTLKDELVTNTSATVTMNCEILHSKHVSRLYKVIHICSATIFLLVLTALIFFYYSTSRRLSLAQKNQPASASSTKLAKSRRNMLVLVSVFCICFVPYHLIRVPYAFKKDMCSLNWWFFYLKEVTVMVSVLNVCLDPLLYFIFCKAFRSQMSLRRVMSTTQVPSEETAVERRSSDMWLTLKNMRKMSLTPSMKNTNVL